MSNSEPSQKEWIEMNLRALDIERKEIRHWQNMVPKITFWVIAGIFGIAAFVLSRPSDSPPSQIMALGTVSAGAIAGLTACYYVVGNLLKKNILSIHRRNLPKLEKELFNCGEQINKENQFVYTGTGKPVKQVYIQRLSFIVCILGTSVTLLVLIWSIAIF